MTQSGLDEPAGGLVAAGPADGSLTQLDQDQRAGFPAIRPSGPRHGRGGSRTGGRLGWLVRTCFPTIPAALLALLVCVVAPVSLVAVHVHENPLFSPLDEAAHYDYVNRVAGGSIPRLGQPMMASTLRAVTCRGSVIGPAPPCSTRVIRPRDFGGGGLSYEAQQPPAYYAVTVPFRWLAVHVFGLSDLSGTRAVGALWLVSGLLMLWATGRVLGLDPKVVGAGVLLVAVSPAVVYESSIVTNTASMVCMGSMVALAGALAWKWPGRWVAPVLFLAGVVAAAAKETGALPAVVVSVLFAILACSRHLRRARRPTGVWRSLRQWLPSGGALLAGAVASVVAWSVVSRDLSLIDPRTLPTLGVLRGYPVGVALIAKEAVTLLTPGTGSYDPFRAVASTKVAASSTLSLNLQAIIGLLLGYLFIAGGAAGAFVRRREWHHWAGLLALAALFVGGVVLGIGIWVTYNADPGLSGRYGLVLLPFLALALVAAVRGRWLLGGLWTAAVATGGVTLWFTLVR